METSFHDTQPDSLVGVQLKTDHPGGVLIARMEAMILSTHEMFKASVNLSRTSSMSEDMLSVYHYASKLQGMLALYNETCRRLVYHPPPVYIEIESSVNNFLAKFPTKSYVFIAG